MAVFQIVIFLVIAMILPVWAQDGGGYGPNPALPEPLATKSVRNSPKVTGWQGDAMPLAPKGFRVTAFARGLDHPRSLYVLPNGDVLTAEANTKIAGMLGSSADRIMLLRDSDGDGVAEFRSVFIDGLERPFGMTLIGDSFYVANTNAVLRFSYQEGSTQIDGKGEEILDLPAGGYNHHWTRNLLAAPDKKKIYISVGSASNNAEYGMKEEYRRANILEINPDGSGETVFASGLRNPVGMDWNPVTGALWTVVNERDKLGDDLVPDYMTGVEPGGFYGWPYSYFGNHPDPRMEGKEQDLVARAIVPDYALGAHTAALGLVFYDGNTFPGLYRNGAFVALHGSWNRSDPVGYKVIFIPFTDGHPAGQPVDFLANFMKNKTEVRGRPVSLAIRPDGALLVSDDDGNAVWQVSAL